MRHGGRTATAGGWRFGKLADFGLHVQREIASDFGHGPGQKSQGAGHFRDSLALGMPGNRREWQRKFFSQELGDLPAAIPESCERSSSAAKLQHQRIFCLPVEALADAAGTRRAIRR